MKSAIYDAAILAFGQGVVNWIDGKVRGVLVTDAYKPDPKAHVTLSDVPQEARIAGGDVIGRDMQGRAFMASEVDFGRPAPGVDAAGVVIYFDAEKEADAVLVAAIGRDKLPDMPYKCIGKPCIVEWQDGKVFSL